MVLITLLCTCMQWLRALLITVGVAQIPMVQSEQQGFSLHQAITMWLWTVLLTWVLLTLVAWLLDRKVSGANCLRAWAHYRPAVTLQVTLLMLLSWPLDR